MLQNLPGAAPATAVTRLDNGHAGCRLGAAAGRPASGRPAVRQTRAGCRVSALKRPIPTRRPDRLAHPPHRQEAMTMMEEQFFDDLARGLDDGTISRRRALSLTAGAALGTALTPLVPKQAEALSRKFRRLCVMKGGVPRAKGSCHCAMACTTSPAIPCHGNNSCVCYETVLGKGFCADSRLAPPVSGCSRNAKCPTGTVCLTVRGGCIGVSCTGPGQCGSTAVCINGSCQDSFCLPPCPS